MQGDLMKIRIYPEIIHYEFKEGDSEKLRPDGLYVCSRCGKQFYGDKAEEKAYKHFHFKEIKRRQYEVCNES